jgi:hypothetical protein
MDALAKHPSSANVAIIDDAFAPLLNFGVLKMLGKVVSGPTARFMVRICSRV